MTSVLKTIVLVNGTGRQAASLIRVASAVGYHVRAQVFSTKSLVAEELAQLPNVSLFEGTLLDNPTLIRNIFDGAHLAFINTTSQGGDEVKIGKALANAAKTSKIQHYVYSSMPDHSIHNPQWPALPLWASKFAVENYIRQLELPATFVYAGIYNNNFTSLPYPLFCMELNDDGSIDWKAPFHPDTELPWLDAEHDLGPAVLQIFKDGPTKWKNHRVALAFETLTPRQVCAAFSRALHRPCEYVYTPRVDIKVPIPNGYRNQLAGIEALFGKFNAPYLPGPEFEFSGRLSSANSEKDLKDRVTLTSEARRLWEGWRGMEEYAKEAFLVEEEMNGSDLLRHFDKRASTMEDNLAMFANIVFIEHGIASLSEKSEGGYNVDTGTPYPSPANMDSTYNSPIQLFPLANGFQIDQSAQLSTYPSPDAYGNSLKHKAERTALPAMSAEEASYQAAEEDKRRRNTAASARFRVKKKQREQTLEKTVKEAQDKKSKLEARIAQLEMENKWIKSLITEMDAKISEDFQQAHQKLQRDGDERDTHVDHQRGVGTK
jgi:NmrA-like family/Basic region leucine zipper